MTIQLQLRHISNRLCAYGFLALLAGLGVAMSHAAPGGFTDVTGQSGLLIKHWNIADRSGLNERLIHSGGAAAGDFDGDGWVDLYYSRLGQRDLLLRNLGGETPEGEPIRFQDVGLAAGFDLVADTNGPAWGDIDNDGDLDLYLTALGTSRFYLYLNNGDGTFVEVAEERGADLASDAVHWGQSVSFGDYDRDGWLDFHTTEWGVETSEPTIGQHSVLMRNLGAASPGHFENVTQAAGVDIGSADLQYGFASSFTDLDGDGWPDLAVTSDFRTAKLFWNNGDGTFHDGTDVAGVNLASSAMGSAIADYNGDGLLDWYVTSIHDNRLYVNRGDRTFFEIAESENIADGSWGWGSAFLDIENDGDQDIVMTNGWYYTTFPPEGNTVYTVDNMKLWRNNDGSFEDVGIELGVTDPKEGKGLLTFDYDKDGDLDIFVVNNASTPVLYRNDIDSGNSWLQITLVGTVSNRQGVGAKVWAQASGSEKSQLAEMGGDNHFLGQSETMIHFGFAGSVGEVDLVIEWPSGIRQELQGVGTGERIAIQEPEEGTSSAPSIKVDLSPAVVEKGEPFAFEVEADGFPAPVFQWYRNGVKLEGENRSRLEFENIKPYQEGAYKVVALNTEGQVESQEVFLSVDWNIDSFTIARVWNEILMDAIRKDFPAPTVHARNLYHLSAAMWDVFWAYEPDSENRAKRVFFNEILPEIGNEGARIAARREAISYAAYRILKQRYSISLGKVDTHYSLDWIMQMLGYDESIVTETGNSPAAVGNRVAATVLAATLNDGSNEINEYADTSGYEPSNEPLVFDLPGSEMQEPNQWQPLAFEYQVTQNGIPLADKIQTFVGVNWQQVETFSGALKTEPGGDWDPGPPPLLGGEMHEAFLDAANEVIYYSSLLDPNGSELIDISPKSRFNNSLGSNNGEGYAINPVTGEPYQENWVLHADYGRVLAEFWADGPESETPPGHWNVIYNRLRDEGGLERKYFGLGETVDELEWDVVVYLTLNGAMHDAAIAAWWLKREYDYVRPISMIRYLASQGQSSDPLLPSYSEMGIKLVEGLVEVITNESVAVGQRHQHLAEHVGEIAIRSWAGEPNDAETEVGGVDWILAKKWRPYQRATFVTPAFAAYVSGHSTFSRAGAEVLTVLTGTPYFPGGLGQKSFQKDEYLEFENGPSETITLQWATYYDAADQAGLSRLYGGIHVWADDFIGREVGARIGLSSALKVMDLREPANANGPGIEGLDIEFVDGSMAGTVMVHFDLGDNEGRVFTKWGQGDESGVLYLKPHADGRLTASLKDANGSLKRLKLELFERENTSAIIGEFEFAGTQPCLVSLTTKEQEQAAYEGYDLFRVNSSAGSLALQYEMMSDSLAWAARRHLGYDESLDSGCKVYLLEPGRYRVQLMGEETAIDEIEIAVVEQNELESAE